jgi:hypothetical protein
VRHEMKRRGVVIETEILPAARQFHAPIRPPSTRPARAIQIYLIAWFVGLVVFLTGHHYAAFGIIIGTWVCLVAWLRR